MENLERRLHLAAQVVSVIADNRGEVIFQMNQGLNPATVNNRSVFMHTTGADGKFGTADDQKILGKVRYFVGNRRITFRTSALPVNTTYSMKLNSKRIFDVDGNKIDGEFNGVGAVSGNGVGGGDFLIIARKITAEQTARFSTEVGAFNISLFNAQTPQNVANFVAYANTAAWDGTFIHRTIPGFITQGGGFNVNKSNQIDQVVQFNPVANEPGQSNVRGTIALARPDDGNPATDDRGSNQWFFNLADNSSNLDNQNGGFTAFGKVTNDDGMAVVDLLAGFPTINAGGVFSDLPVKSGSVTVNDVIADPGTTLILIRRVAILNKVQAYA